MLVTGACRHRSRNPTHLQASDRSSDSFVGSAGAGLMRGKPRRQDGNESRPEGGQAPDQASSGRQTGAPVPPGQITPKARTQRPVARRVTSGTATPGWRRPQTDRPGESYRPLSGSTHRGSRGPNEVPGRAAASLEVALDQGVAAGGVETESGVVVVLRLYDQPQRAGCDRSRSDRSEEGATNSEPSVRGKTNGL